MTSTAATIQPVRHRGPRRPSRLRVIRGGLRALFVAFLVVGGVAMAVPFIWMVFSSIKPSSEILKNPPTLLPTQPTLANFRALFGTLDFGVYLINTLIVVAVHGIGLFLNVMAGYAFAKFRFRGDRIGYLMVLSTMLIPGQATMVPTYVIINRLGLTDSLAGIALPGLVSAFNIFLARQFMSTLPGDVLDSARVDGAGETRIFISIVLPMAKPLIGVLAITTFLASWNSFLWPLVVATSQQHYTLSVALALVSGQYGGAYELQMAGATFMVVPIVVIFVIFQRLIVQGFVTSGLR